jgi:hypothetical protein
MITLNILHKRELEQVPSASGIEVYNDLFYVVGDNSPWLFKLDSNYAILEKFQIAGIDALMKGQIAKKDKPDFEAMTLVTNGDENELLIFGSGSKSPLRDGMVRILIGKNHEIIHFSLSELYEVIRKKSGLGKKDLNIEAATADAKNLYLFNRGKNRIIIFKLKKFLKYLSGKSACPVPEIFKIKLPKIGKIKAGFSGASTSPDGKSLIFTASVENTSDWVDDGEILGSFVGVIPLRKLRDQMTAKCVPIMSADKVLEIKVESVSVSHVDALNGIHLLLVTDSDGKESELLEAVLHI